MNKINWISFFCAVLLLFNIVAEAVPQGSEDQTKKSKAVFDPLSPGSGDFLDINISGIKRQARAALINKKYVDAASLYLKYLRSNVRDATAIYNLACCYSQLQKSSLAAKTLLRAVKAGFSNVDAIKKDRDLDNIRMDPVYMNIIDFLMKKKRARGNIRYFKAEKLIKSRIHLPDGFDPKKRYPLVIGLHGNGGNAEGYSTLWTGFPKRDFIFVCPDGPYEKIDRNDIGERRFGWGLEARDRSLWLRSDTLLESYLKQIVSKMKSEYSISKVFLFGFSAGSSVSMMFGIRNPELFAGVAAVGGRLPLYKDYPVLTEDHLKKGNSLPVLVVHGRQDRAVRFEVGEKSYQKLKSLGYNVKFHAYNEGHRLTREVLDVVYQWIKKL